MQITSLHIRNFKSIRALDMDRIENALILVGKNNSGKTSVLNAILTAMGARPVSDMDFNERKQNIEISMTLIITDEDLALFHSLGLVSQYKRFDAWLRDFQSKLPSFREGQLSFKFTANWKREVRYSDGIHKNNRYIPRILPKIYFIDTGRNLQTFQEDLLLFQDDQQLMRLRSNVCMFNAAKQCNHCFSCIGLINRKKPEELTLHEAARLLEYKLYRLNLQGFAERVNENYRKNGGYETIRFTLDCDPDAMFHVSTEAWQEDQQLSRPVECLSNGMKCIYMLSLLETYMEDAKRIPSMILIEYPELFLHPSLQKTTCDILYRLSAKNQVIFTTHAPAMLSNFTRRQLRQIMLDEEDYSIVRENADIDEILDHLGYGAADAMNASFVFIVEGSQDKSRLPLLLKRYYSDVTCEDGSPARIAIITTNSCTNIKTYANLKYMNQVYLKDQFLMIRDGDGKDPEQLAGQLCRYYEERGQQDADKLPRIRRRNVLILKYYSFENYFLNPEIMTKLGIVESVERFYEILFEKWNEYLYRIKSGRRLVEVLGHEITSVEDLKAHMELFKIHMRGHNLYDIFYGRYRKNETELLERYLELAPRDDFKDILDAIDAFPYFDSRKV